MSTRNAKFEKAMETVRRFHSAHRPGVRQNSQFAQLPANIGTVIARHLNKKSLKSLLGSTRVPMEVTRHLRENNGKRRKLLDPLFEFARKIGKKSLKNRRNRSNGSNSNNNGNNNNGNNNGNNNNETSYKKHIQKLHVNNVKPTKTKSINYSNENPYWEHLKLLRNLPHTVSLPKSAGVIEPLTTKNIISLKKEILKSMKPVEISGNMMDPNYTEPFFTTMNIYKGKRVVKPAFLTTKNGKTSIALEPLKNENGNKMFIKKLQPNGSTAVYGIFSKNIYNPFNTSVKNFRFVRVSKQRRKK
jgi:hypothetical protein